MSTPIAYGDARGAFAAWRSRYPTDPYGADDHLDLVNERYLEPHRLAAVRRRAGEFGKVVAGPLGVAVAGYQTRPPELRKYDGAGNPLEEIVFDEAYHDAGRHVWASGLLEHAAAAGASFEQANLFYLASLEGEMGHMCAATCTTGLVRVLRRHSPDLAAQVVPQLTASDYDVAQRGAQFLTEVQGGSDVGAVAAVATEKGAVYQIDGEKWFCSVADADQFLLLARPSGAADGTAGLACFLVPRRVAGELNGFSIRRLKDKLGTTSMASGEFDFTEAEAHLVGDLGAGFKIMVTAMLNTSRWLNAIGDVGIMRRAYLEAVNYAAVRRAFGKRIGDFPVVRLQLAHIKADWLAALHSTWELTALDEAVDLAAMGTGEISATDAGFHRYLVNANKLGCSLAATGVVRQAIEILGGNGAIEDFSVLPRLLRDAVVYEQWEGTHNVLTAQVLRDLGRLGLAGTVVDRTATILKGIAEQDLGLVADRAQSQLEELTGLVARCLDDPGFGALHFRGQLERLLRLHQIALLLQASEDSGKGGQADELAAAAALLLGRYVEAGYRPEEDAQYAATVDALVASDL
ncbi:MAG: acyl-CoA dehydrogenase family protein [Acidimicrobiia bacterium]|nr:acyl-CoA dehydrogenase family protein [Acidimicrobiia bacterium]